MNIRMLSAAVNVALVATAGLVVTAFCFHQYSDRRSWRYMPDMDRSFAFASQSANPWLPNGQTAMAPPAQTIARGQMPVHTEPTVKDYANTGRELQSPFGADHPPDMQRAQWVFTTYCQVCHGETAAGNGLVPQHGFPQPPSLLFGKAVNMRDGHIFHIITNGWRKMPAYGPQIDVEDRWLAIAWVRKLQGRVQ